MSKPGGGKNGPERPGGALRDGRDGHDKHAVPSQGEREAPPQSSQPSQPSQNRSATVPILVRTRALLVHAFHAATSGGQDVVEFRSAMVSQHAARKSLRAGQQALAAKLSLSA